jgi:hypothetical protein
MKRKPYPHEDLVQEIRKQITSQDYSFISDDHDMYYTDESGYSPMKQQGDLNSEKQQRARECGERLVEIGEAAAEAVALGLRMQGGWRESLLPFADEHRGMPVIHEALVLVAKRERDPLALSAADILEGRKPQKPSGRRRRW